MRRFTPPRTRPKGYDQTQENALGAVFYTETPKPCAIAFGGKSNKAVWHHEFRSVERMHIKIAEFFANRLAWAEKKALDKKERNSLNAHDHFAVGDIMCNSWGYDQTNIDWYQVMLVTDRTIILMPIGGITTETGNMSGHSVPCPSNFPKDAVATRHTVTHKDSVSMRHGSCSKWDGSKEYCSWYA